MTVVSVDTDHEHLTVTVIAEFDAPVERVWELWTDARKLERWWGPPAYPATFIAHDLVPGGQVRYLMTSPEGEQHAGIWRVTAVDPPVWLQFDDIMANADWEPIAELPVTRQHPAHRGRRRHTNGDALEVRIPQRPREVAEHGHTRGARTGHRPDGRAPSLLTAATDHHHQPELKRSSRTPHR